MANGENGMPAIAKLLSSPWPYHLVRVAIGVVFLWAGLLKILDPMAFAGVIEEFRLVPRGWAIPLGYGLPVVEAIAGVALIVDFPGSHLVIGGLLVMFLGVLGWGLAKGLDVDCGCFGPGDPEARVFHSMWIVAIRDVVMLAGVVYSLCWRRWSVVRRPEPGHP